jgi:hypothetical protein
MIEANFFDLAEFVTYSDLDGIHLDDAGHAAGGAAVDSQLIAMF